MAKRTFLSSNMLLNPVFGAKSAGAPRKANKYHAKRVGTHASKKEHQRAATLRLWQRAGVISNLREQVPFVLIPAQQGERPCKYIADFVYTDNETGQTVVEDTKGVLTDVYRIKRKLMLYVHGIRIKEV